MGAISEKEWNQFLEGVSNYWILSLCMIYAQCMCHPTTLANTNPSFAPMWNGPDQRKKTDRPLK